MASLIDLIRRKFTKQKYVYIMHPYLKDMDGGPGLMQVPAEKEKEVRKDMASVTAEVERRKLSVGEFIEFKPKDMPKMFLPPPCVGHATNPMRVYLIGSLRNKEVMHLANRLRALGIEVFDDWHAAGPEADDYWQQYETARGRTYKQALQGAAAKNVFAFDKRNLDASDAVVLVMPAGKSGHLELGYCCGKGKHTAVFFTETPERYDVMYQFADFIAESEDELITWVKGL